MAPGAEQQVLDQAFRFAHSAVWPKRHEGGGGARHLQGFIGSIIVVDDVEPAQIGRMWQFRQALEHRGFDRVARLPRGIQQSGNLIGTGAIEPVRDKRRQGVEEQPGNMTVEDFGDLADGCKPNIVCRRAVQPNHHVLDHGHISSSQYPISYCRGAVGR
jgi:hypothetical protein